MLNFKIPFNDLRPVISYQRQRIREAMERVLDSGVFIQGPEVKAFEEELAKYCGVNYVVSCANGTDAITLALRSQPVKNNILVNTVANSAPATVAAIRRGGYLVNYIDIDPTGIMDHDDERKTSNAHATVMVNLYGQLNEYRTFETKDPWEDQLIIEDGAQSLGTKGFCKSQADLWTTSFYPTKNLGALGDGGAIMTNNKELAGRMRQMANYGLDDNKFMKLQGWNSRLDELQAAILRERLKDLDMYCDVRRKLAKCYDNMLDSSVKHRVYNPDENYHLYTIIVPDGQRDFLRKYLADKGIGTAIHYVQSVDHDLPVTKTFQEQVLSLPLYPGMEQKDIWEVACHVNDFIFKNAIKCQK